MAGRLILGIANPALDSNGKPDAGSTLTFYQNGTTTLQSVYSAADLLTPLANPLDADAAGRFPQIWAPDGEVYSVKWSPTGASPITYDDISSDTGTFQQDGASTVTRTYQGKFRDFIHIFDWIDPDIQDEIRAGTYPLSLTTQFNNAVADILANSPRGESLLIPGGIFPMAMGSSYGWNIDLNGGDGDNRHFRVLGAGRDATKFRSLETGASTKPLIRVRGGTPITDAFHFDGFAIESDPASPDIGGGQNPGGYGLQIEDSSGTSVENVDISRMQRGLFLYNNAAGRFCELTRIRNVLTSNVYQHLVYDVNAGDPSFNHQILEMDLDIKDGQQGFVGAGGANVYDSDISIKFWGNGTVDGINLSGNAIVQLSRAILPIEKQTGTFNVRIASGSYWLTDGFIRPEAGGAIAYPGDAPFTADVGWGSETFPSRALFKFNRPDRDNIEDIGGGGKGFRNISVSQFAAIAQVVVGSNLSFPTAGNISSAGNAGFGMAAGTPRVQIKGTGSNDVLDLISAAGSAMAYAGTANLTSASGENGGNAMLYVRKDSTTSRSLNAAGTINASGADVAESKRLADGVARLKAGAVCGLNDDGRITNRWVDLRAPRFVSGARDILQAVIMGDLWGAEEAVCVLDAKPLGAKPKPPAEYQEGDELQHPDLLALQQAHRDAVASYESKMTRPDGSRRRTLRQAKKNPKDYDGDKDWHAPVSTTADAVEQWKTKTAPNIRQALAAGAVKAAANHDAEMAAWLKRYDAQHDAHQLLVYCGTAYIDLAQKVGTDMPKAGNLIVLCQGSDGGIGWQPMTAKAVKAADLEEFVIGRVERLDPDGTPLVAARI